jgi:uncharacterized membrane protein YhdT
MNEPEFEGAPADARPRTATVIGLLAVTAAIFSYLLSYAVANALVAADVVKPWQRGHDPRPKWFIISFVVLNCVFLGAGWLMRHSSARNIKEIELMEDEA